MAFASLATLLTLALAAAHTPRPEAIVIAATGALVVAVVTWFGPPGSSVAGVAANVVLFSLAALFGDGIRAQRERAQEHSTSTTRDTAAGRRRAQGLGCSGCASAPPRLAARSPPAPRRAAAGT